MASSSVRGAGASAVNARTVRADQTAGCSRLHSVVCWLFPIAGVSLPAGLVVSLRTPEYQRLSRRLIWLCQRGDQAFDPGPLWSDLGNKGPVIVFDLVRVARRMPPVPFRPECAPWRRGSAPAVLAPGRRAPTTPTPGTPGHDGMVARGEDEQTARLRALCLALPEVEERLSHGEPTWFVRGKKSFVMLADHHHDDRLGFWCAAPEGARHSLVAADPVRYFVPPYVGHRGWLGVRLDPAERGEVEVDPDAVTQRVEDAYRAVAPKTLVAELDERT